MIGHNLVDYGQKYGPPAIISMIMANQPLSKGLWPASRNPHDFGSLAIITEIMALESHFGLLDMIS